MHIWIIQSGEPMFTDGENIRPMRAMNLASKAVELGHEVTIITSNFDHFTKKKRFNGDKLIQYKSNMAINFVDSPGYSKNISPQRFIDHFILGYRMKKLGEQLKKPDVAFIGYPPIETSWFMARMLNKIGVPYVLDVKDAWPTIIIEAFPKIMQPTLRLVLSPYYWMFRYSANKATRICSISESFLKWSQDIVGRTNTSNDFVAPLTSREIVISNNELRDSEVWFAEKVKLNRDNRTIYFIGSLSRSFNFEPIIEMADNQKINLIIGGDGEQFEYIKNKTNGLSNVFLLGWVNVSQSQVIAKYSDFALAPMKPLADFEMSIPNKFYDYMRQGKPILSSLNGDSRELIENFNIGIYYRDFDELEEIISSITLESIEKMSTNSKQVFVENFNYDSVYSDLVLKLFEVKKP